jgi:hypothetical protein
MKDKKSIILYLDSLSVLNELTDEQAGKLFKAIKSHSETGSNNLEGLMKAIFIPFENYLKSDFEKWEKKCEINRLNGGNGGRPPKTQKNPVGYSGKNKNPKKGDTDTDTDTDTDIDIIKENILKEKFGEFKKVKLTRIELEKVKDLYGSYFEDAISKLDNYLESKGDKYKNHYAVLQKGNWVYREFASLIKEEKDFRP